MSRPPVAESLRGAARWFIPVSYTHLDVYKRQGHIAEGFGERLAAEGEICWGAMHSWRRNVQLLEQVGMPKTVGFQADMAHTMLFTMGYNAPEDRLLPENYDFGDGHLPVSYTHLDVYKRQR